VRNNFYLGYINRIKSLDDKFGSGHLRMNEKFHLIMPRGFSSIGNRLPPKNIKEMEWRSQDGYTHLGDFTGSDLILKNS